jgi:hypothetical protein
LIVKKIENENDNSVKINEAKKLGIPMNVVYLDYGCGPGNDLVGILLYY